LQQATSSIATRKTKRKHAVCEKNKNFSRKIGIESTLQTTPVQAVVEAIHTIATIANIRILVGIIPMIEEVLAMIGEKTGNTVMIILRDRRGSRGHTQAARRLQCTPLPLLQSSIRDQDQLLLQ
jgi:hypothetical protein